MKQDLALLVNSIFYSVPRRALQLFQRYDSIKNLVEDIDGITDLLTVSADRKCTIKIAVKQFNIENYKENLRSNNVNFITIDSELYPQYLKEIYDPPIILFYKGDISLLQYTCFSVVGSRDITEYGTKATRDICRGLLPYFILTSGLAMGVDSVVHHTALDSGAPTIAILGCGIDIVYPKQNKLLYSKIEKRGLILSEFPLTTPAHKFTFPQRNRIVSGLSKGVLITEAKERSGSLITAQLALEQNKDVFAVPGSIYSKQSAGSLELLSQGAKLVRNYDDILSEYDELVELPFIKHQNINEHQNLTNMEKNVLDILGDSTLHLDDILHKSKASIQELMQILMLLEINDHIIAKPGKHYALK